MQDMASLALANEVLSYVTDVNPPQGFPSAVKFLYAYYCELLSGKLILERVSVRPADSLLSSTGPLNCTTDVRWGFVVSWDKLIAR